MPADPRWEQLTSSTKAAWRWAWATATVRTGAAERSGVQVDTVDLLAGLALAQLRDNPVLQLFEHFHIPPGAVLSDRARGYRPEALLAAYRRIPDAELPPLDKQTEQVLEHARSALTSSKDGLVTLSMLFGALLETVNDASAALRAELARRGVDVEAVMRSCREHLDTRSSYEDYLGSHHPYRPPKLQLTPYAPDEPRTRRPPTQPGAELSDLVGIREEVNAFAYLIASKTLTPPLAIGLFGDWGSGKSYFLRSMQRRLDQLVITEVDDPPFHRAIVQVEFNAWQYVEGNLWASLLEHLFRNLLKSGEQETAGLLEERRNKLLSQINAQTAEHSRAVKELHKLAERQRRADQHVQEMREERDRKLKELGEAQRRNPFRGWRPSAQLSDALADIGKRTGLDELSAQTNELGARADELRQTLESTGESLRQAGPVLAALRTGGWRYTVAVLALLVVLGLGPLTSFVLSYFDVSAVSNVLSSVSALLAGLTAYAASGNKVLTGTLRRISRAQTELNAELDAQHEQLNQEIREAETTLADTQRELALAEDTEHQLATSVAELEAQLAQITPSSMLAEFLGDRFASDDYRRHLGMPALVRQDLERLSQLVQQRHNTDPAEQTDDHHAIDRVVLYIDDLDRCPTHVVIKVLEAVHLLLAFPLFVVVVAVDARWLESSLREHYTQLRTATVTRPDTAVPLDAAIPSDTAILSDAAIPSDYLEKIFQVPFWIRPLGADTRRHMVRGLLRPNLADFDLAGSNLPDPNFSAPNLAGSGNVLAGSHNGPVTGSELSEADRAEFVRLVESFTVTDQAEQPWLEAAKLTVTAAELHLIEEISPLIAATPRAVKRFINVYLLVKSVGQGRGWPLPEQGQVALLLAIATGLPELVNELLPHLTAQPKAEPLTLGMALPSSAAGTAAGTQLAWFNVWLKAHPTWRDVSLAGMDRWVELILRFRFNRAQCWSDRYVSTP